jgi:integrase
MRDVYASRTYGLDPLGEIFMKRKITDTAVRTIRCPADMREIFVRDTELRGFGMRVSRNVTSFIYEARRNGRPQRQTIGQWPAWSADEARERAADLRRGGGEVEGESRYERDHLDTLSPTMARDRRRHFERHILPAIGGKRLRAVTHADCIDLHRGIKAPYEANRAIETLRRLFNLGIKWGWTDRNPAIGIERNQETPRNDYLAPKQIEAIFEKLPRNPSGDLIRVLLLTGCRPSEAMRMAWSQVDLDGSVWTKPASGAWSQVDLDGSVWTKPASGTKQRREHRVPLSPAALEVIKRQTQRGPLVFTRKDDRPVARVEKTWRKALRDACVPVLGHSVITTTQRYAHLYDEEVRKAVDIVAFPAGDAK